MRLFFGDLLSLLFMNSGSAYNSLQRIAINKHPTPPPCGSSPHYILLQSLISLLPIISVAPPPVHLIGGQLGAECQWTNQCSLPPVNRAPIPTPCLCLCAAVIYSIPRTLRVGEEGKEKEED